MRMPIDQCIEAYKSLSSKAFTERNIVKRTLAKVNLGPKFETLTLEALIKDIAKEDLKMAEINPACKV